MHTFTAVISHERPETPRGTEPAPPTPQTPQAPREASSVPSLDSALSSRTYITAAELQPLLSSNRGSAARGRAALPVAQSRSASLCVFFRFFHLDCEKRRICRVLEASRDLHHQRKRKSRHFVSGDGDCGAVELGSLARARCRGGLASRTVAVAAGFLLLAAVPADVRRGRRFSTDCRRSRPAAPNVVVRRGSGAWAPRRRWRRRWMWE